MKYFLCLLFLLLTSASISAAEIQHIWLTHRSQQPDRIVVNWHSSLPGNSIVQFGLAPDHLTSVSIEENTSLHHVEIPLTARDTVYFYRVQTGTQISELATFKAYPTDSLRVAIIADWQSRPDLSSLMKDDVHLLLTAGDNINNLWQTCGPGKPDCIQPYLNLIGAYPELFRSTPFMPILGNHDREVYPRGKKPPEHAVYDVDATAFRLFFELPDEEWKWQLDFPDFQLRFAALDFNHISDRGTTWQTCHPFDRESEQYCWYESLTQKHPGHLITLYNERNATMRNQLQGDWQKLFQRGTLCVTGFGYFAERAEAGGIMYYNTSLSGTGTKYPDPHSKFLASKDSYLLLTSDQKSGALTVEIKSLKNEVLDRQQFSPRSKN